MYFTGTTWVIPSVNQIAVLPKIGKHLTAHPSVAEKFTGNSPHCITSKKSVLPQRRRARTRQARGSLPI